MILKLPKSVNPDSVKSEMPKFLIFGIFWIDFGVNKPYLFHFLEFNDLDIL